MHIVRPELGRTHRLNERRPRVGELELEVLREQRGPIELVRPRLQNGIADAQSGAVQEARELEG
jgi:hypothetical protein